jgi:hypothetical protein
VNVICRADQNILVVDAVASEVQASPINNIFDKLLCHSVYVLTLYSMLIVTQMKSSESVSQSPLQVAMDPGLRRRLEEVAQKEGISLAEVFRRAFLFYYASQS